MTIEEKIPRKSGIYKFTNILDGKIYIGKAKDLRKRILGHYSPSSNKTYFDRALKKHGWDNFSIELLHYYDSNVDKYELLALETAFIDFFKSLKEFGGYNICLFGDDRTGVKHSEETKKKMSKNHARLSGIRSPSYGRPMSNSHKELLRKINTGRKISEETRMKLKEARNKQPKGKDSPSYGRKHSLETKELLSKIAKNMDHSYKCKRVEQIDKLTNKLIRVWDSVINATIAIGLKRSCSIAQVARQNKGTAGGFYWRYYEEPITEQNNPQAQIPVEQENSVLQSQTKQPLS